MVEDHIKTYGHIFIGDLMILTGEMCELMSAMGYDDETLRVLFPNYVAAIVEKKTTSVKDDTPNPFMTYGSSPRAFIGTTRYDRLRANCPKMNEYPKLSSKASSAKSSFWDIFKKDRLVSFCRRFSHYSKSEALKLLPSALSPSPFPRISRDGCGRMPYTFVRSPVC